MKTASILRKTKHVFQGVVLGIVLFGVLAGSLFLVWGVRPNEARFNEHLAFDHWAVVADGRHNSNTDMIRWNGTFYMIHASAPFHMGSTDTYLELKRSSDLRTWTSVVNFTNPGGDIRDPKFAIIGGQMFIYFLNNEGFMATPYETVYVNSSDGITFSEIRVVQGLDGWLFWRPKTRDNVTFFVAAYWHEHGASILLSSTDGITWTNVSTIWTGGGNDETAIEFLPDGRLLATCRLEIHADTAIGHENAGTGLAVASPPYTAWNRTTSHVTRLDGPFLFTQENRIFAIARYQPEADVFFTRMGGVFSRKRTSLYEVTPEALTYISDFPSAGDTSYAGVVIHGTQLYACYYSSDTTRDFSWVLGMLAPSDILVVNMTFSSIMAAAASPLPHHLDVPWDGYMITAANAAWWVLVIGWLARKHGTRRHKA